MKRNYSFIYTIFGLMAIGGLFFNGANGQTGKYSSAKGDISGACGTSGCHDPQVAQDPAGSVKLTGAPASFTAGVSYPLTLTIKHSGGLVGGFQIIAVNNALELNATNNTAYGTLVAGAGSKLTTGSAPGRLIHTAPKNFTAGTVSWTFNWTAPATGTNTATTGVKFYFAGNAGNNSGDELGDAIYTSSQLTIPVELIAFSGKMAEKGVKLTWKTASERNNNVFIVERSSNGNVDNFEKVGEVKGLGNNFGIATYDFSDDAAQADKAYYYRLRQVDFDGTTAFSKIISIGATLSGKAFKLYPNFVNRGGDIQLESENNDATTYQIVDIAGKTLQSVQKGQYTEGVKIATSNLPTGQYFVRTVNGLVPNTQTFIVF